MAAPARTRNLSNRLGAELLIWSCADDPTFFESHQREARRMELARATRRRQRSARRRARNTPSHDDCRVLNHGDQARPLNSLRRASLLRNLRADHAPARTGASQRFRATADPAQPPAIDRRAGILSDAAAAHLWKSFHASVWIPPQNRRSTAPCPKANMQTSRKPHIEAGARNSTPVLRMRNTGNHRAVVPLAGDPRFAVECSKT